MKVCHLSSNDLWGGAARATHRLHQAFLQNKHEKISSQIYVSRKQSDLCTVYGPNTKFKEAINRVKSELGSQLMRLQCSPNPIRHSPAFLPSKLVDQLNAANIDILHLHWICAEFLSVEDIGRLTKPLVWTLHDSWAFCGAEHYFFWKGDRRFQEGYYRKNRPKDEIGIDLNRWVWNRKRKAWKHPIHIVCPSRWLAECAQSSILMRDWPIFVIPNALDTTNFRPFDKNTARDILGLPLDQKIILFGAIKGTQNQIKGWDLLEQALVKLATQTSNVISVVFGQSEPQDPPDLGLQLHWMGHLHDDVTLALLYSAADVMVVPSRQEAFGQTGSEAQSCGCPVVAFNCSGLIDVILHKETGYLATPFDSDDLANGIIWILADPDRYNQLSTQSRDRAVKLWSLDIIAKQYIEVYEQALAFNKEKVLKSD